jgi:hypothetical protein
MGYTTRITGKLKFKHEISVPQLKKLQSFYYELPSDHKEWENPFKADSYIQWQVSKEYDGLEWDGNEKFYSIVETMNLIIHNMRLEWPEFAVEGTLECQGEDTKDFWYLKIEESGLAYKKEHDFSDHTECPACGHMWVKE